jgi:hypothetical protein
MHVVGSLPFMLAALVTLSVIPSADASSISAGDPRAPEHMRQSRARRRAGKREARSTDGRVRTRRRGGTLTPACTFSSQDGTEDKPMITRSILAALLAAGTAGAALADVKVNTPGANVKAPSGGVELDVNIAPKVKPVEAWIGRAVYSSDGKHLGEVAAIADDQMYVDIGGFLGIGESRVLLSSKEIGAVADDRIMLTLTEAEAEQLPTTSKESVAPAK